MKKRIIFIFACLWIIISFMLIKSTYAKYLSAVNANANVSISVWNIVLNEQNIIKNSNFSSNLSLVFPGNDYYSEGFIVPGSIGYFDLTIDTSSVTMPFKYSVIASPDATTEISDIKVIGYSLDGNNDVINYLNEENSTIENSVSVDSQNSSIRVYMQWVDDDTETLDDDADTELALDGSKAVVLVNVLFEQTAESNLQNNPENEVP